MTDSYKYHCIFSHIKQAWKDYILLLLSNIKKKFVWCTYKLFKYCKVHLIPPTIPQVNTAWVCTEQNKTDTQKAPTALELKTVIIAIT